MAFIVAGIRDFFNWMGNGCYEFELQSLNELIGVDGNGNTMLHGYCITNDTSRALAWIDELSRRLSPAAFIETLNIQNEQGITALHLAILLDRNQIAAELIDRLRGQKGALNLGDCNNKTPIYLAISEKNEEIALMLIEALDSDDLHPDSFAEISDFIVIEVLPPLLLAIRNNLVQVTSALLEKFPEWEIVSAFLLAQKLNRLSILPILEGYLGD